MSDESPNPVEKFNETVSFAILESRPEIPSFDTKPGEWEKVLDLPFAKSPRAPKGGSV